MAFESLPPPLPARPEWLSRNWKWVIPAGLVVVVAGILVFVFGVISMMRTTDVYVEAHRRAVKAPAVVVALGEPITDRIWFTGNISIAGSGGRANLAIPIAGPKGQATIYVAATRIAGAWTYDRLTVVIEKTDERIDLSDGAKPQRAKPGRPVETMKRAGTGVDPTG